MELGAFSVSLTVKDLGVSRALYTKLGFESCGGNVFARNVLTFNPGWNADATVNESFEDVRSLHRRLSGEGLEMSQEAGLDEDGPASFVVVEPDGSPVLTDQHVNKFAS